MIKEMSVSDIRTLRNLIREEVGSCGTHCYGNKHCSSEDFLSSYCYVKLIKVLQELVGASNLVQSDIIIHGNNIVVNDKLLTEDYGIDAFKEIISMEADSLLQPILDMKHIVLGFFNDDLPYWMNDAIDNGDLLASTMDSEEPAIAACWPECDNWNEIVDNMKNVLSILFSLPDSITDVIAPIIGPIIRFTDPCIAITQHLYISKNIGLFKKWMLGRTASSFSSKERELFRLGKILLEHLLDPMDFQLVEFHRSGFTDDYYFYLTFSEYNSDYDNYECTDSRSMKYSSFISTSILEEVIIYFDSKYGFLKGEESEQYAKYA